MADETMTVPRNGRLVAKLGEWSQTAIVIGTIIVSGIRWSNTVDSRLGTIEEKIATQRTAIERAVGETTQHANLATEAATRAEAAVVRAEGAVVRAEDAVTENHQSQQKVIAATADNRKAIEKQTRRVTDLQTEVAKQLEAFS